MKRIHRICGLAVVSLAAVVLIMIGCENGLYQLILNDVKAAQTVPRSFTATKGTSTDSVILSWDAVEGADTYYIYPKIPKFL